ETVREVDHGRRRALRRERPAQRDAWLGAGEAPPQGGCGITPLRPRAHGRGAPAERAAHPHLVAGACPLPADGTLRAPERGEVEEERPRRGRQVAPQHRRPARGGRGPHAPLDRVEIDVPAGRGGERDEHPHRLGAHGRDVAERGRGRPPADLLVREPGAPEVHVLDREVRAHHPTPLEHRGVVAGAERDARRERRIARGEGADEVELAAGAEREPAGAARVPHRAGSASKVTNGSASGPSGPAGSSTSASGSRSITSEGTSAAPRPAIVAARPVRWSATAPASVGSSPWAMRQPATPASESPMPAAARSEEPCASTRSARPGAATREGAPLKRTAHPKRSAACRATAGRSAAGGATPA